MDRYNFKNVEEKWQAYWEKNNFYGIIKHATGSGKTFTGINGIKKWLKENNVAIVLVPSVLLLEQWVMEVENELSETNLVKAGGGEPKDNWLQTLRKILKHKDFQCLKLKL